MISIIKINNLQIHAFHGVLQQEHSVGNDYKINCSIRVDVSKAMSSDNVEDTINYAEVVLIIQREMKQTSNLLEHVAGRIIKALRQQWVQIETIELTIEKLCPPIPNADIEGCAVKIID